MTKCGEFQGCKIGSTFKHQCNHHVNRLEKKNHVIIINRHRQHILQNSTLTHDKNSEK